MKKTPLVFIKVLLSVCIVQAIASTPAYTIIDLGTLGGEQSYAYGINKSGQVVGYAVTETGVFHAFLYSEGKMIDLGTLGGSQSFAYAINDSGQIVGGAYKSNGDVRGFLYTNGAMTELGTLGGTGKYGSTAWAINNKGQITGYALNANGARHAFLYDNGVMSDIGTLGGTSSIGNDINDNGQIIGNSTTTRGYGHAFLYSNGVMTDIGTLGGTVTNAYGINNSGQITGSSLNTNNGNRAFIYEHGLIKSLGSLPEGTSGWGMSINNNGQITGVDSVAGTQHTFLYDNGTMTDLNTLIDPYSGWLLYGGQAINDSGMIAGFGTNPAGAFHAFVLTPIPEPAMVIPIDIKPGTCPNPLNRKSKGVLPVAVLGSDVLDVNDIDVASLEILGVRPIRSSVEDVAAPVTEEALQEDCLCTTNKSDGYMDLTLKFNTQELIEAMGEVKDRDSVILTVTGCLKDETPIEGTDCVLILEKGKESITNTP